MWLRTDDRQAPSVQFLCEIWGHVVLPIRWFLKAGGGVCLFFLINQDSDGMRWVGSFFSSEQCFLLQFQSPAPFPSKALLRL